MADRRIHLNYLPHVDGLRAIAVIVVVLFHLDIPAFKGGFVGVDVFLVISGYLITNLIWSELSLTNDFSFKNFYLRRIRRLLPALLSVVTASCLVAVFIFSPSALKMFGRSIVAAILSYSNINFWLESDYFDVSAKTKPLLHTWSLSLEEQFYLVWPLTIFLIFRTRLKNHRLFLLITLAALSFGLNFLFKYGFKINKMSFDGKSTIFFLLPFRIFEFLFGAALVGLPNTRKFNQFIAELLSVVGLGFILFATAVFSEELLFPYYYAVLPCLGAALVIQVGRDSKILAFLKSKPFVWTGLISYSLYLVHWPIIVFWHYLDPYMGIPDIVIIVVISFVLAVANYRFIETRFRTPRSESAKAFLLRASMVALVLFVMGVSMSSFGGWTWRIKSKVGFEDAGSPSDFHVKYYGGAGYRRLPVDPSHPPDIVIMGDSHGQQYAYGVSKLLAEPNHLNLQISVGASCIQLPHFTRSSAGVNWDKACPESYRKAISDIKSGRSPIVILSQSWVSQLEMAKLIDDDGSRLEVVASIEHVFKGIEDLVNAVYPSKLFVIGQVPTTDKLNLYDVFSRPYFLEWFLGSSRYLTSPVLPHLRNFNSSLRAHSLKLKSYTFLDPFDALCDGDVCRNLDGEKRLIYSDTAHLSRYGSMEVISYFLRSGEFKELHPK